MSGINIAKSDMAEAAAEFVEKTKNMKLAEFLKLYNELTDDVKGAVSNSLYADGRCSLDKYFVPENAGASYEETSLCGLYRLKVTSFGTKPGCWSYTQGLVYRGDEQEPLFEVRRNYRSFWSAWVLDHPNGHDYLVCGEDYQGQTVLELDTGKRRDFLPSEAEQGAGFCWVEAKFDAASKLLIVAGCVWACPYEYRIFDFADPMSGWPELEADGGIDEDKRWPTVGADGSIVSYQTAFEDDSDDATGKELPLVVATKTWRREGMKLVLVSEWMTDEERERRRLLDEAIEREKREVAEFKASDPLYLAYVELVKDPALSPKEYESYGITYEGWCQGFDKTERRWCRRIVYGGNITIDLEWATKTGPVKLTIYRNHKHDEDKVFHEHSVESMREAFEYAKAVVKGGATP